MSKDHFYFTRNDRIVAIILLFIIIAANLVRNPLNRTPGETAFETDTLSHAPDTVRRIVYVRDTVRRKWYVRDTVVKYRIETKDTVSNPIHKAKIGPESPLDLNTMDSTGLVKLPGIGPVFASRIIRYREQLGGFSRTDQLTEIKGLPDSLMKWFFISDTVSLRRIRVNRETVAGLQRHPYLNFYQAKAIVDFRKERGNIKGPEQLSFLEEFTVQDLERVLPYLDFR